MNDIEKAIEMHHRLTDNLNSDTFTQYRETVLQAMQEKAERDNPKPLTLEELRQMDGEPVWINDKENNGLHCRIILMSGKTHIQATNVAGYTRYFLFEKIGKTWLAYRNKPEC